MLEWTKFGLITLFYATASGFGLYLLKASDLGPNFRFLTGVALYGLGFLVWLWMLRSFELSVAFPVAAGSLVLATQLFGLLLGEQWGWTKLMGSCLIVAGMVVISTNLK